MERLVPPPPSDIVTACAGRLWPSHGGCRGARHEPFGDFLLVRPRHLPTDATIASTLAALGEGAAGPLSEWRALWDRSCDLPALAAACGHVEPPDRRQAWASGRAEGVRGFLDAGDATRAAAEAVHMERFGGGGPVRPVAFHVLEDAVSLVGFATAGVPLRVLLQHAEGPPSYMVAETRDGAPRLRDATKEEAEACDERAGLLAEVVNPNWSSRAFRASAGRDMALCTGFPHLLATLLDMSVQGHAKAFLKHAVPKRGTWVVDIGGAMTLDAVARRVNDALGLAVVDLHAGRSPLDAVLVQEFLPFTCEHRFFCVGHRVVASTPSVRGLGLLDAGRGRIIGGGVARLASPAHAHGPYDRGEADLVEDRALLAAMARGARDLASGLRRENRFHGNYVVDMGLTERGVVAVEVNTFVNAGLYALDHGRVARSLARWYASPSRRPAPDPEAVAYTLSWQPVRPAGGWKVLARARAAVAALGRDPDPPPARIAPESYDVSRVVSMLAAYMHQASAASGKGGDDD